MSHFLPHPARPHRSRREVLGASAGALALLALSPGTASAQSTGGASARAGGGAAGRTEQRNTEVVLRLYEIVHGRGAVRGLNRYVAADLLQHDPAVGAGRAGLVAWAQERRALDPTPVARIAHVLAEGSLVAVHAQVTPTPQDPFSGTARVDLYRLEDHRVVEQWAVTQAVPRTSVNGHTMFSDLYRYPGQVPVLSREQEDANKQLLLKAWPAAATAGDLTVLDRYWAAGTGYLQHNPFVPDGVVALAAFLGSRPPTVSQVRLAVADADLVLTFSQVVPTSADLGSDATGIAIADLFRVVDGRFVEHWDVLQPVPATTASGLSMFSSLHEPQHR